MGARFRLYSSPLLGGFVKLKLSKKLKLLGHGPLFNTLPHVRSRLAHGDANFHRKRNRMQTGDKYRHRYMNSRPLAT